MIKFKDFRVKNQLIGS